MNASMKRSRWYSMADTEYLYQFFYYTVMLVD